LKSNTEQAEWNFSKEKQNTNNSPYIMIKPLKHNSIKFAEVLEVALSHREKTQKLQVKKKPTALKCRANSPKLWSTSYVQQLTLSSQVRNCTWKLQQVNNRGVISTGTSVNIYWTYLCKNCQ
jgi:hypothetical protein